MREKLVWGLVVCLGIAASALILVPAFLGSLGFGVNTDGQTCVTVPSGAE